MKKTNRVSKLVPKLFLICSVLFFINCQDEPVGLDSETNQEQENPEFALDKLSFDHLQQENNFQSLTTKFNIEQPIYN